MQQKTSCHKQQKVMKQLHCLIPKQPTNFAQKYTNVMKRRVKISFRHEK